MSEVQTLQHNSKAAYLVQIKFIEQSPQSELLLRCKLPGLV